MTHLYQLYMFSAAVVFLFLAVIWKTTDIFNIVLKFLFSLMSIAGFIAWLEAIGYIVRK